MPTTRATNSHHPSHLGLQSNTIILSQKPTRASQVCETVAARMAPRTGCCVILQRAPWPAGLSQACIQQAASPPPPTHRLYDKGLASRPDPAVCVSVCSAAHSASSDQIPGYWPRPPCCLGTMNPLSVL